MNMLAGRFLFWLKETDMPTSDQRAQLAQTDNEIFLALKGEEARQPTGLELIPSENYALPEVMTLPSTHHTNKHSDG